MQINDFMNFGPLNQAKDYAISQVLTMIINSRISGAGKVQDCRFESKNNSLKLSILFNEEPSPINVTVTGVGFLKESRELYVTYEDLRISRSWMDQLYHDIVEPEILGGKRLQVPEKYAEKLLLIL